MVAFLGDVAAILDRLVELQAASGTKLYEIGAQDEPAKDVLIRALALFAPDRGRMTWLLLYGNALSRMDNLYVLNLIPIPSPSSSSASSSSSDRMTFKCGAKAARKLLASNSSAGA